MTNNIYLEKNENNNISGVLKQRTLSPLISTSLDKFNDKKKWLFGRSTIEELMETIFTHKDTFFVGRLDKETNKVKELIYFDLTKDLGRFIVRIKLEGLLSGNLGLVYGYENNGTFSIDIKQGESGTYGINDSAVKYLLEHFPEDVVFSIENIEQMNMLDIENDKNFVPISRLVVGTNITKNKNVNKNLGGK